MVEIKISEELREVLSEPFGSICNIDEIISYAEKNKRKLVCIGDFVTLSCIKNGFKPFVAVFDFKTLRKNIDESEKLILKNTYNPESAVNNPGTFNTALLEKAKILMKNGGGLLIEGEEDITGLAFMAYATHEHIITYGIKDKGPVFVLGENAYTISSYILLHYFNIKIK
jgi:uncharacterized protein (UPF0218 family)